MIERIRKRKEATTSRRRLGRGLESLIGSEVPVEAASETGPSAATATATMTDPSSRTPPTDSIHHVPVEAIRPNRSQPRQCFDEQTLTSLAESISRQGLMQPILVRPDGAGGPGRYELIIGERRWRAVQLLGLPTIPAVIKRVNDRTAAEMALIENLQREDLNPIERAEAFRHLIDEHGLTHQELAELVGLNRSSVTNFLRLNDLDEGTKEAARRGLLSLGHAKALLAITNPQARRKIAAMAMRQDWSVRSLEQRIASLNSDPGRGSARNGQARRSQHDALAREIGEQLGTRVSIVPGKKKHSGKLVIEYFDLDQFDGLMERLGVTPGR